MLDSLRLTNDNMFNCTRIQSIISSCSISKLGTLIQLHTVGLVFFVRLIMFQDAVFKQDNHKPQGATFHHKVSGLLGFVGP